MASQTPLTDYIMQVWKRNPTKGEQLERELRSLFNLSMDDLINKTDDDVKAEQIAEALAKKLKLREEEDQTLTKKMYPSMVMIQQQRSKKSTINSEEDDIKASLYPSMIKE